MVEARLKMKNGAPAVYINGEEFPFSQAITVRTHKNGKIIFDEEYFKGLHRAGIRLYYVTCDTDWCHADNLENLREECGKLLSCVPNAYIMVRIGLHPPVSFVKDHPEECFTYNDGVADPVILANETFKEFYPHLYSEASDKWREEAGNALIDMCEKIEKEPFSDRIIGYFSRRAAQASGIIFSIWNRASVTAIFPKRSAVRFRCISKKNTARTKR